MIREEKFLQYGVPRKEDDIQGITIHETGNIERNAESMFKYYDEECKIADCCHYICDDVQTIQIMPDNWMVYHTGKGKDWGNIHTIAIQICSSLNTEKYNLAQNRAIQLIKDLIKKYNIDLSMIFFHNDWDNRQYCPKTIKDKYETSKNFVESEIKEE